MSKHKIPFKPLESFFVSIKFWWCHLKTYFEYLIKGNDDERKLLIFSEENIAYYISLKFFHNSCSLNENSFPIQ